MSSSVLTQKLNISGTREDISEKKIPLSITAQYNVVYFIDTLNNSEHCCTFSLSEILLIAASSMP